MNLSGLLPLIEDIPSYRELVREIQAVSGERKAVVVDSARPYLIAALFQRLGLPMLVITARSERARQLYEEAPLWLGSDAPVRLFPEPDALPYERLSSDMHTVQQRLRVLSDLSEGNDKTLVVAPVYAVAQKTVPVAGFSSSCHLLKEGSKIDLERMLAKWMDLGYEMESIVELPGTLSRRGGIVDIYPSNSDLPARIELSGDEVESIRLFDPATQRSLALVPQIAVVPAREMAASFTELTDIVRQLDHSTLKGEAREKAEEEMEYLARGRWFDGLEFYTSLANDGAFFDYFPERTLVVLEQPDLIEATLTELDIQAIELSEKLRKRGELPIDFPRPYYTWSEFSTGLNRFNRRLNLELWGDENECRFISFRPAPGYDGLVPDFIADIRGMLEGRGRVIVISQQAARLSELLGECGVIASPVADIADVPPLGSVTLAQGSITGGWFMDGDIVFSDVEIFGFVKKRRMVSKRPVRHDVFLSELLPGDYVVHVDHGIGMFSGLTRMGLDDGEREYLVLEYAAGDKLYVPTEQVDRVGRYLGPGGYAPSLSRLGTQEWSRAKRRVKEATGDLAKELLLLYSAREAFNGFAFSSDSMWQQELEASFPYVETPDQLRAVREVKRDMEKAQPMDRLICGDVGYGKTEVAVRAAFKAVMDGMQVAVLVPTTVLAQQHLTTFGERLGTFPVRVEMLSRFRTPQEQREVIQGLASGSVDICIGTHRLIQKDVAFKNLGLVIIDEEQRFGVTHKERLKQLRKEVDVLTLSATPIPRTLHMSLIGVRDMSTMETPPEERYPIKTYVAAYNERLVREAILRELERDGQVFYVHNRVQRINGIVRKLEELVPEARIDAAHGQMHEDALESVMLDFTEGRIDVLVCTTIIESGLDLPNVNTLIVDDADRMGLTQLYQLRGRVGRGANRAYAYFFYKQKQLTEAARKRLRTIFEAAELGAGFRIAMKDLGIRGAGNLLGSEQSGHIGAVGFELYSRLLSEAVSELKAGDDRKTASQPLSTTVDISLAAFIPDEYVNDLDTRLALYMRLARVDSLEEMYELGAEIEDRFGPLPLQVKNLLYIVRLKLMARGSGIRDIIGEKGQIVIRLGPGFTIDKTALQEYFGEKLKVGTSQLRLDIKRAGKQWKKILEDLVERTARTIDGS